MNLDEQIAAVERNLVDLAPTAVITAFEALVPTSVAFLITPVGRFVLDLISPIIKWMAGVIIKFFDDKGYYLYKIQINNKQAEQFVDTARATNQATESGDKNAIAAARAAERAAFLAFWPLTS